MLRSLTSMQLRKSQLKASLSTKWLKKAYCLNIWDKPPTCVTFQDAFANGETQIEVLESLQRLDERQECPLCNKARKAREARKVFLVFLNYALFHRDLPCIVGVISLWCRESWKGPTEGRVPELGGISLTASMGEAEVTTWPRPFK